MKYLKCDVERLSYAAPVVKYTSTWDDPFSKWTVQRVRSFVAKILMEANKIQEACGYCGDTIICGSIIGTILCAAYPIFTPKSEKEDGLLGILNGSIKVYLVDDDAIDPETLLIGHITDTSSTTRVIKFEGLKDCFKKKDQLEVFNE